ncbi:hypothetical protein EalM132_00114 [Exiguobacterium phage vB_EalM-132]|nr:hypothetical protein EalM132_00114 [Exiguobacterium phage vB_EalM-132]
MQQPTLSSTGEKLLLSWDAVLEQFDNLIKYAAKKQVQGYPTDNMISVEDLYQEGIIKLYDCWKKWCVGANKDMDEFGPIFRKSLFRAVRSKASTSTSNNALFVDLESTENMLRDENQEDVVERMYRENGIEHLSSILSSEIAVKILGELAEPSPETLFEVWADVKRKEMLKSQGKRVNIPKDTTVRMKHIIRALGITQKQYDVAIVEIRQKAHLSFEY